MIIEVLFLNADGDCAGSEGVPIESPSILDISTAGGTTTNEDGSSSLPLLLSSSVAISYILNKGN